MLEQCNAAQVPFFFKQWGGKRKGQSGRVLNGRTYDAMPARRVAPMAGLAARKVMAEELRELAAGWPDSPLVQLEPE